MKRVPLRRQVEAVALAHVGARHQLGQLERTGRLTDPERALKRCHVLALRAARETLRLLMMEAAGEMPPGAARLHHDAMVEGTRGQLPDFPPDFDVGESEISNAGMPE
jgi:hypothetical protein